MKLLICLLLMALQIEVIMKCKIGFISGNGENPLKNVVYLIKINNPRIKYKTIQVLWLQKIVKNIFIEFILIMKMIWIKAKKNYGII